jgi:hypothetical protein
MNDHWQQVTLGELYRKGLAKARKARRKLRTIAENSPVKLDLQAAGNLIDTVARGLRQKVVRFLPGGERPALPGVQEPKAPPSLVEDPPPKQRRRPWQTRSEQLQVVMAEAWDAGSCTYAQLMEWVKLKTGKGCSHRAIARFRKSVED